MCVSIYFRGQLTKRRYNIPDVYKFEAIWKTSVHWQSDNITCFAFEDTQKALQIRTANSCFLCVSKYIYACLRSLCHTGDRHSKIEAWMDHTVAWESSNRSYQRTGNWCCTVTVTGRPFLRTTTLTSTWWHDVALVPARHWLAVSSITSSCTAAAGRCRWRYSHHANLCSRLTATRLNTTTVTTWAHWSLLLLSSFAH